MAGRSAPLDLASSGLGGAAFDVVLLDIERWGMSLMLLYFGCLEGLLVTCATSQVVMRLTMVGLPMCRPFSL